MLTVDDMLERLQMELPKSMKNECGRILSLIMEQKGLERQQTRKRIRDAKGNYQSYPMNLYPVEYLPAFKTIAETIIEASR